MEAAKNRCLPSRLKAGNDRARRRGKIVQDEIAVIVRALDGIGDPLAVRRQRDFDEFTAGAGVQFRRLAAGDIDGVERQMVVLIDDPRRIANRPVDQPVEVRAKIVLRPWADPGLIVDDQALGAAGLRDVGKLVSLR